MVFYNINFIDLSKYFLKIFSKFQIDINIIIKANFTYFILNL
jgi:hypothetical protein